MFRSRRPRRRDISPRPLRPGASGDISPPPPAEAREHRPLGSERGGPSAAPCVIGLGCCWTLSSPTIWRRPVREWGRLLDTARRLLRGGLALVGVLADGYVSGGERARGASARDGLGS